MERSEKHETDGQAADVGEGSVPDGGSQQGLPLCPREWGPAVWAQGTETVWHEVRSKEPELAFPGLGEVHGRMDTPSSCPKSVASKIWSFPSFHPCLPKLSLAAVSPLCPSLGSSSAAATKFNFAACRVRTK